MNQTSILVVVGTRPEAIKMAPVVFALKARPEFRTILCASGQHREMLSQALDIFGLQPDVDLQLMTPRQDLAELTSRALTGMRDTLRKFAPAALLVHGDTTTCLATTLAAFYERIPVGHVEAGLRTYDFDAPWPEEMNRRLTDPLCRWCFAPTERAAVNLRAEHIPAERIFVTGNTAIDALNIAVERVRAVPPSIPGVGAHDLAGKRIVLVTGHRRESFGGGMRNIANALKEIAEGDPEVVVIYPVHLNPQVETPMREILGGVTGVKLLQPLDYLQFVWLMTQSAVILTDSGGIQEEAPSLGKPVLVMRDTTERPEAVEAGTAQLVGTDTARIVRETRKALASNHAHTRVNPYGDGHAAERIVAQLLQDLVAAPLNAARTPSSTRPSAPH